MIHYHGTPCGGSRVDVARFLTGRHALIPFVRPDDLAIAADVCQSFCLDNGAFSAWTRGIDVDWNKYYRWVDTWCKHPGFDFSLIPDVIDGGEKANDQFVSRWIDQGLAHYGCPIWHLDESIDRFVTLCNSWSRVALGSSGQYRTPNTGSWWKRIAEALEAVCDDQGRPCTRLHGLRMLNSDIFTRIPLASADSTNATVNAGSVSRFGIYKPPTAAQRAEIIAARIEAHNSAPCWMGGYQHELIPTMS